MRHRGSDDEVRHIDSLAEKAAEQGLFPGRRIAPDLLGVRDATRWQLAKRRKQNKAARRARKRNRRRH